MHEAKYEYRFVWQKQMHNGKPKIQYVQCQCQMHIKAKSSKFSENQTSFQSSMQNQIVCDKCGII